MDFAVFDKPRPDLDSAGATRLAAEVYGITGLADPLQGERDRSFKITTDDRVYVLKVGNDADRPDALEAHSAAMEWAS
ncbi:MAG: hypothetical protein WCA93_00520, partial [Acidimicrobiia bacterium]